MAELSNAFRRGVRLTNTRYLAAYYSWYFAATGVSEPYLPPFWRSLGFSPTDLGVLNAIAPAVSALAPFLWTACADLTRHGDRIFLVNTWLAALVALLFPRLTGFWLAAAAILIYAAFRTSLIPLANSMTFRALAARRQGYAAIRLWGTRLHPDGCGGGIARESDRSAGGNVWDRPGHDGLRRRRLGGA